MKKSEWKKAAQSADTRARGLAMDVDLLKRQVEDMRKNWRPIPIPHPWVPRDPTCLYCDDPREAERHQVSAE